MAEDVIPHIAQRYSVSEAAARQIEASLRSTGGRQAQFDHPDLGGHGQWMPGMIQIGKFDDPQLKVRVQGLAAEIAAIVRGMETSAEEALSRDASTGAASGCVSLPAGESWWPASLGHPASEGDQNGVRYAFFPATERLLVQMNARIDAYDTAGRQVIGVRQEHEGASPLRCITTTGAVDLSLLRCIDLRKES
jgi:hypothetical protein